MQNAQHPRAFLITIVWTLGLLYLGSVVHATESSLACPDWPTCFGTMVPEMTGGVFWEHLHRLVAGGLMIFFIAGTYLAYRESPRFLWIRRWALLGVGLLFVQAALGGITVIFLLPDAVSTSHLGLAFLFLALAAVLWTVSADSWSAGLGPDPTQARTLRKASVIGAILAFVQSIVGAAVRHTDAGMGCPDVPLCLGQWIPPLDNNLVALHFGHRVTGLLLLAVVLWVGHQAFWKSGSRRFRTLGIAASVVALGQVLLGYLSVYMRLSVAPVSLHTLLAATLLTLLVVMATLTWAPWRGAESAAGVDGAPEADSPAGTDGGTEAELTYPSGEIVEPGGGKSG